MSHNSQFLHSESLRKWRCAQLFVTGMFVLVWQCAASAQSLEEFGKLASLRDSNGVAEILKAKQGYESHAQQRRADLGKLHSEPREDLENKLVLCACYAAICDYKLGNTDSATKTLEQLIADFPDCQVIVLVYTELGFIYQRSWRAEDSERCLSNAERLIKEAKELNRPTLPPKDVENVYLSRAINYVTLGKDSLARARLAQLSASQYLMVSVEAQQQLATLDFNANRPYVAIKSLRSCLKTVSTIRPRTRDSVLHEFSCHIGLARYYRQHGRFSDGKKELAIARQLIENHSVFLLPSERQRHLVELDNATGELILESTWALPDSTVTQGTIFSTLETAESYANAAVKRIGASGLMTKEVATSTSLLANVSWRRGLLQLAGGEHKAGTESLRSAVSKFADAIKLYENLSTGLPIVPELQRNKAFISAALAGTNDTLTESKILLEQSEGIYGAGSLPTVLHHDLLSLTYSRLGNHSLALHHADISRKIYNQALPIHAAGLTPAALQMFFRRWEEPALHAALRLTINDPTMNDGPQASKGLEWLANGKAKSVEILARISQALSSSSKREQFYSAIQKQAALLYGVPNSQNAEVENALLLLEEQKRRDLEQTPVPQESVWIDLPRLAANLESDEVFVDIFALKTSEFSYSRNYFAWLLFPSGSTEVVKLGDAERIDELVDRFLTVIEAFPESEDAGKNSQHHEQSMSLLRSLSRLVFEPLWERIGDKPKWIVSPDGSLWNVPWPGLLLPDGETFAVERVQFRTVIAGRDLVQRKRSTNAGPAIVVADPAYDALPAGEDGAWRDEKSLVAAPLTTEGNKVFKSILEAKGSQPILMSGYEAAEERLVEMQKPPSLLYMATHGLFLQRADLQVEDPFLCCFLALKGYNFLPASTNSVPGVLTGSDVLLLKLEGTGLVVLSACQTGRGISAYGHSSASLRHAFHLAGANAVVATVWSIPSKQTSEVMLEFIGTLYSNSDGTQTTDRAEALQQAQLEYLNSTRRDQNASEKGYTHPFYWAAFSISGF